MDQPIDVSYPLHWPEGWPRTPEHRVKTSAFARGRTLAQARGFVLDELRRLGAPAGRIIFSSNVLLRADGLPRSGQPQPQDKGVAVYFRLQDRDQVLACDRWNRVEDNIYAIGKHVEAVRAQARHGVGTMEQAFRGYQALPAAPSWWQVLGVPADAALADIDAAFQRLALEGHTDRGGTADMGRLRAARDEGRKAQGTR